MFKITAQTVTRDLPEEKCCYGISCPAKDITVSCISTDFSTVEKIAAKLNNCDTADCRILREIIEDCVTELYI